MLTEERRARIVDIVNEKKAVSVNELIELLDTYQRYLKCKSV